MVNILVVSFSITRYSSYFSAKFVPQNYEYGDDDECDAGIAAD